MAGGEGRASGAGTGAGDGLRFVLRKPTQAKRGAWTGHGLPPPARNPASSGPLSCPTLPAAGSFPPGPSHLLRRLPGCLPTAVCAPGTQAPQKTGHAAS